MNKTGLALILFVIAALLVGAYFFSPSSFTDTSTNNPTEQAVTNFEECAEAGNPVMESYPRQCRHEGVLYIEDIAKDVPIEARHENRIIYTFETSLPEDPFVRHCTLEGGTFNSCGSPCPPDAELCAQVCVYTCELPE